jgi:hypothetical protein
MLQPARTRPASSPGRAASLRSRPVRATKATWRFRTRRFVGARHEDAQRGTLGHSAERVVSIQFKQKSNNGLSRADSC